MNNDVLFSKASDEWTTPLDTYDDLDAEFEFILDAAADSINRKCWDYRGPDHERADCRNGLVFDWAASTFVNPPYSQCRAFVAKASEEAAKGNTVVMLVPSRSDTRRRHEYVWDRSVHAPYPGVEIRFIKGRLKFGNAKNGAPFPSVVIVFRPLEVV